MEIYSVLADLVALAHLAYVLFVVFGLVAVLLGTLLGWGWTRNFWFRVVHLAMIGVVVAQSLVGMICPLTTLESYLRRQAGQEEGPGRSFIAYWVHQVLFFEAPQWVFTLVYCLFGAAVLAAFVLAPPRRRGAGRSWRPAGNSKR